MIELRAESSLPYVIEQTARLGYGEINSAKLVPHGVLNWVREVDTPYGKIFFKQALGHTKRQDIGKSLRTLDKSRIETERRYILAIQGSLPASIRIPNALHYDPEHNIVILTDAGGPNYELLEHVLLDGRFDPEVAHNIGKFLGCTHNATYGQAKVVRGHPINDIENWDRFLEMRTKGIILPDVHSGLLPKLYQLYEAGAMQNTYDILMNQDPCPKNIVVGPKGIGVFDFETASGNGDPAYDLGFALGHYFLFGLIHNLPEKAKESARRMVQAYKGAMDISEFKDFENRMIQYAGAVMLYRCAGASPARYIPSDRITDVLTKGAELLKQKEPDLDIAIEILQRTEISHWYKGGIASGYLKSRRGTLGFADFIRDNSGLEEIIKEGRQIKVVELGPGSGQQTVFVDRLLAEMGADYEIAAFDKSVRRGDETEPGQLDLLIQRIRNEEISDRVKPRELDIDGTRLPLDDDSTDFVIMAFLHQHLGHRKKTWEEISRVTRPGGRLFVYGAVMGDLKGHHLDQHFDRKMEIDARRYPTLSEMQTLFADSGFEYQEPFSIVRDANKPMDWDFFKSVENTSHNSALKNIAREFPEEFKAGVESVRKLVEAGAQRVAEGGDWDNFSIERTIYWGIKK